MPAVTREYELDYGGYKVGGATDRLLDGAVRFSKNPDESTVEYYFVLTGFATDAAFVAATAAVEEAFRKVRQDFVWTQGASEVLHLKHSDYTGFDSRAEIFKQEDVADTTRTRRYGIKITFGLPANFATTGIFSFLRESTVHVQYTPARKRTVTISGTYTAKSTAVIANARSNYEALIDAYTASILTSLGGIYELAEEPRAETNIDTTVCSFQRVFDEIIYPQGSLTDDPQIVRQSLLIRRHHTAPGDSTNRNTKRLVSVSVTYDAWVNKDLTTDLKGKWQSLRGFIIARVRTVLDAGAIALIDEMPNFDGPQNRISASLELVATAGSNIIENRLTTEVFNSYGPVLVPVWTGDPYAKFKYDGPADLQKTETEVYKILGKIDPGSGGNNLPGGGLGGLNLPILIGFPGLVGGGAGSGVSFVGTGGQFAQFQGAGAGPGPGQDANAQDDSEKGKSSVVFSKRVSRTPLKMGRDGFEFSVTEITIEVVTKFYTEPKAGGGGTLGGRPPVQTGGSVGGAAPPSNNPLISPLGNQGSSVLDRIGSIPGIF